MPYWKWSTILTVASISGGLFLTFLSGLYIVKPFIVDAEIIYFGFPFPWLEAYRSAWKLQMSWRFLFLWRQFIFDFMIYGLFAATAISIYFMSFQKRRKTTTHS